MARWCYCMMVFQININKGLQENERICLRSGIRGYAGRWPGRSGPAPVAHSYTSMPVHAGGGLPL